MEVKGVGKYEVERIVAQVSNQLYDGNVAIKTSRNRHNSKGIRSSFTIRALDSRGAGARRSWRGRRMPVACWHAHWHVLDRLFRAHPDAEVRTMLYRATAATFHDHAADTAFLNAGSALAPVRLPELCDCMDNEWEHPTPIPAVPEIPRHPDQPTARSVAPLVDRIAREVVDAEALMEASWVNAYVWNAHTPHPYEVGAGFRSPV